MKTSEAIKVITAKLRYDLTAVGGFDNGMVGVPAEGVRKVVEALEAALAVPPTPLLLKGIGKIAGDGFKDETRIGEVIYAWNREHPAPHTHGQFPRLGNPVYAASAEQFAFFPVEDDELIAVVDRRIEELRMQVQTLQDEKRDLLRTHAGAQAASCLAKLAAYPLTEHDEARPGRPLFSAGDTTGDWTLRVADVQHARAALKACRADKTDLHAAVQRVSKYLAERSKVLGLDSEIHGLHAGHERETSLTVGDLETVLGALQGLREAQAEPVARDAPEKWVRQVMEQAQVFASAWALVGSRFDNGGEMDNATAEKEHLRKMISVLPATPPTTDAPAQGAALLDQVRALLWDEHPECCGSPVVGAEYMGQQEMVCCGCPEPALLTDAQIVASLRALLPEDAPKEGAPK